MPAPQNVHAANTHEAFAQYLKRGLLPANTEELQRLSVALYRSLGSGRPVTREQLSSACGYPPERIEQLLSNLLPTTLDLDDREAVTAFGGLSLAPTHHRLVVGEVELHTWCVLDALFLPEILGKPATLVTHCHASAVELTVELSPSELRAVRPAGCVMSIIAPDHAACCTNLRRAFCDQVNLFADRQTFLAWAKGRHDVGCVTLQEAHLLARRRNALRYPDVDLST